MDMLARFKNDWAGLPVPIPGERLIVESKHPAAEAYRTAEGGDGEALPDGCTLVNCWYSHPKRGEVYIWREADGQLAWGVVPTPHHFRSDLGTMGCSVAWSLESEAKAQQLLSTLIPPHLFKMYMLTGMFPETSKRSGVSYIFRRLRPTVAMKASAKNPDGEMKCLACLCLHPIGYYKGTWAGAMCPTDDVIAHLLLMRGDERMFWRRANQIPAYRAEAGL